MNYFIVMETLGTREDSIVMSIGTLFVPDGEISCKDTTTLKIRYGKLYILDIEDEENSYGRTIDVSTIKWWLTQNPEILKDQLENKYTITMEKAVDEILMDLHNNDFFSTRSDNSLWSRGLFEAKLWESMTRDLERQQKIMYWRWRDSRTACDVVGNDPNGGIKIIDGINPHNPTDDCVLDYIRLHKLGIVK